MLCGVRGMRWSRTPGGIVCVGVVICLVLAVGNLLGGCLLLFRFRWGRRRPVLVPEPVLGRGSLFVVSMDSFVVGNCFEAREGTAAFFSGDCRLHARWNRCDVIHYTMFHRRISARKGTMCQCCMHLAVVIVVCASSLPLLLFVVC